VLNKTDDVEMVDKVGIEEVLDLESLLEEYPNFNFIYASATTGYNCLEILNWIDITLKGPVAASALLTEQTTEIPIQAKKDKKGVCSCLF
jgi:hypothetical protein